MSRSCVFYPNRPSSREHLWPKWIHERKDFGQLKMRRGQAEEVIIPDPQVTSKNVCGSCNNGWMSDLEKSCVPTIGGLLHDLTMPLTETQQKIAAAWSVKTAMITDSTRGRRAHKFYTHSECFDLRTKSDIPVRTVIWLGRISGMHLLAVGTDFTIVSSSHDRIGIGSVNTIVVGHLVIQVITAHIEVEGVDVQRLPCKEGDWADSLVQIWPVQKGVVHWPPKSSFTNGGPQGIAYLLDRWRLGEAADQLRPPVSG